MFISAITNSINTMNNSAFKMLNANSAIMNLASFTGKSANMYDVFQAEKSLVSQKLNSELMYKMSEAQLKALKKLEKEKIKHSFSTFA